MTITYASTSTASTSTASTAAASPTSAAAPDLQQKILARLKKQTFCTLATASPAGFPHVAGVVYEAVSDGRIPELWIHTNRSSRKARSIVANGRVSVCVPFRRLPVGPPFTIHFQAEAELVDMDDAKVRDLIAVGQLKSLTGHGELDMPDGCFVRIRPRGTVHSFGPGARTLDLIRDPIGSGGRRFTVENV